MGWNGIIKHMKSKWGTKAFYSEISKRLWRKKKQPIAQRFWNKVNKDGPIPPHRSDLGKCWVWTACRAPGDYGCFAVNSRMRLANRVAWELTYGPVPDAKCVLHKCDYPPCCNPKHLFVGTRPDNSRDMMLKGRHKALRGSEKPGTKLTEEDVREIRRLYEPYVTTAAMLAKRFGVALGTMKSAISQQCWKHVPENYDQKRDKWCKGERNPGVVLTEAQVKEMRGLYDSGALRIFQLRDTFGVSRGCVTAIVKRRNWKHI